MTDLGLVLLTIVFLAIPDILMEFRFERCLDKWEFHCENCKYWNCPYGHYRKREEDRQ